MDDTEIVNLYFDRNEQAIKETDKKYGRLCFGIADKILNSRRDAEECIIDSYIGVWKAIPPTRPLNFRSFLCRIVRNCSLKRLEYQTRKKRRSTADISIEELAEVLPDELYAPQIQDEEVGALISAFLREQSEEVRNVFLRKYFYFESVEEIANRYSFTKSKVKNMLFYTRNKLKAYLIDEGIGL